MRLFCVALMSCTISLMAEDAPQVLKPIDPATKHPSGVNKKLMSDDKTYGYSENNPILVGSKDEFGGPKAERDYLNSLLGPEGKPIRFKRLFSGGNSPDGKPLDCYEITISNGTKVRLWISMYHPKNKPERQPAPVGFYKKRK
ncbi:hypothetical protein [Rubritalea tangerina]|uniref:Uncharacterized protein n=1 Tax=Rubritalea tangerina TaxID=430798 RepID=A0ABW4Z6L9_9BACT